MKVIADFYDNANGDASSPIGGIITAIGQTFTGVDGVLDTATFYISSVEGTPTGEATAKIYAHTGTYGTTGTPIGSAIATSDTYDVSTLPLGRIDFIFSGANKIKLVTGVKYVVIFD